MTPTFVHLHNHSSFSEDGIQSAESIPLTVKERGMSAVALTDNGYMGGTYKFLKACRKHEIKPIIGMEIEYVTDASSQAEDPVFRTGAPLVLLAKNGVGYQNLNKLSQFSYETGWCHGEQQSHNRIDNKTLKEYSEGLILLTGGPNSPMGIHWIQNNLHLARDWAKEMYEVFGDRFIFEVGHHNSRKQTRYNDNVILPMSKASGIPCVFTADAYMAEREDVKQRILTMTAVSNSQNSGAPKTIDSFHIPEDEMENQFLFGHEEAIKLATAGGIPLECVTNTSYVASMIDGDYLESTMQAPLLKYPGLTEGQARRKMTSIALDGLCKLLKCEKDEVPEAYRVRFQKDLDVITRFRYSPYFLIMYDIIELAKANNIPVGPGRGSGAGSSLVWAMGLTSPRLDPEKYGLIGERFLNPGRVTAHLDLTSVGIPSPGTSPYVGEEAALDRIFAMVPNLDQSWRQDKALRFECEYISEAQLSMLESGAVKPSKDNPPNSTILFVLGLARSHDNSEPCDYNVTGAGPDIDTDFSPSGRDKLVKLLQEQFLHDHVTRVTTYKPYSLKESVQSFGKAQGKTFAHCKDISDAIPHGEYGSHYTWAGKEGRDAFKDMAEYKPLVESNWDVFKPAAHMDEQPKSQSIHACAVIISPEPLHNQVPIRRVLGKDPDNDAKSSYLLTQFDGNELEKIGFTKFDLLVLDMLDVLALSTELIGKNYQWLETEIPLNEPGVFEMLNKGYQGGLFQVEEGHVLPLIQTCQPTTFEEISDISALIRPGPKNAGLTSLYEKWKLTGNNQNTLSRELNDVLLPTGGLMIYQEQVMAALQILAGFDLAIADKVRRAMGKKKKDEMEKYHTMFSKGYIEGHGVKQSQANMVWKNIETFADYGFNKSHSLAYALITYYCAYMKTHYPVEFMTALMTFRVGKPHLLKRYIIESKRINLNVKLPDINDSHESFTALPKKKAIQIGFHSLSGIGEKAAASIAGAREAGPFKDILDFYKRSGVNKGILEVLGKAGAFDCLGLERRSVVEKASELVAYVTALRKYHERVEASAVREELIAEWQVAIDRWNAKKKAKIIYRLDEPYIDENEKKHIWSEDKPKKPLALKIPDKPTCPVIDKVASPMVFTPSMAKWEGQTCGLFITKHPLDFVQVPAGTSYNRIADIDPVLDSRKGNLLVAVSAIEKRSIKSGRNRGKEMATLTVEDQEDMAQVTLFPKTWEQVKPHLEVGSILYFRYKLDGVITVGNEEEGEYVSTMLKLLPQGNIRVM